jgi:hypothetical protein
VVADLEHHGRGMGRGLDDSCWGRGVFLGVAVAAVEGEDGGVRAEGEAGAQEMVYTIVLIVSRDNQSIFIYVHGFQLKY